MPASFTPQRTARVLRWMFAGLFVIAAVWALSFFFSIGFNRTGSLPGYAYVVIRHHPPVKHELVAFRPPPNDFYRHGWFIKYVKGVPGDVVRWDGRRFAINGHPLGVAKRRSAHGIALDRGAEGRIPPNKYFVWSAHVDSFDSRYAQIGLVARNRIIGRAYRLF